MRPSDSDFSSMAVGSYAEPTKRNSGPGCAVWILLGGVGCFAIAMVVFVAIYVFASTSRRSGKPSVRRSMRAESMRDIGLSKSALTQSTDVRDHPQYDRVVTFVDAIQATLDDTPNPALQQLVDFDSYIDELIQRSDTLSSWMRRIIMNNVKGSIIGPTPFADYDIVRIEVDDRQRLMVHLSYATGYSASEPHIWWLSDDGGLKIYDWSQLELGIRTTTEHAILSDASDRESNGYERYGELCYEYLETSEMDLSFFNRTRRIEKLLRECEQFRGPPALRASVYLITARRWQHQGENDLALALLKKIVDRNAVPGAYVLSGDIHYDRGQFEEAAKSYEKYADLLGPTSHVQSRLAECFREAGDAKAEREALQILTRSISEQNFAGVAQLIELNDQPENRKLFSRIDKLPIRDDVYLFLVRNFTGSPYFADRLELIETHLRNTAPTSSAAMLSSIRLTPDVEHLIAMLKWIDDHEQDDAEGLRYEFWYDIDESQIAEVLESSSNVKANFDTIIDVYEYEGSVSEESMLEICDLVLKDHPEDFQAYYQRGTIENRQGKFTQAIDSLRKSLAAIPDSHDEQGIIQAELLVAIYRSGDNAASLEFAKEPELAIHLLSHKVEKDEYSDFGELLKRLDAESDDHKFYKALLDYHEGNVDSAFRALADLIVTGENEENFSYNLYAYRSKLVAFCEKENDVTMAFTLAPTDTMLMLVTERLVRRFEWQECERLLQSEAMVDRKLQRIRLRQRIDWEQGKYQQVVDQADAVVGMAKTEEMSTELDRLVRSALRIGKVEDAMEIAEPAVALAGRHDLAAIVALNSDDVARSVRELQRLGRYQKERLNTDPDLLGSTWRDSIPSSQLPRRNLYSLSSIPMRFDLQLLLAQSPEFREEQLQATFASALGEDVIVDHIVPKDSSSEKESSVETWVIETPRIRLFLSLEAIDGAKASESCESDALKRAMSASSHQLRVMGQPRVPMTAQVLQVTSRSVTRCLVNDNLRALGVSSRWLTSEEVTRGLDQEDEEGEEHGTAYPLLFEPGEFEGLFFFLEEDVEEQLYTGDSERVKELVSAIKRWDVSADPDKTLSLQCSLANDNPERISVKVDRIRRTGYGSVSLEATVLQNAKYNPTIRKNDKIDVSLHQVESFELQATGGVSRDGE